MQLKFYFLLITKIVLYGILFVSSQSLLLNMLKLLKIPDFSRFLFENLGFFIISQNQVFFRFLGKWQSCKKLIQMCYY